MNLLSCSTTFEMGIDLGDLQAVVMSNVPPRVANYRQRAGRAGRRSSGAAFIMTWAGERPHDQTYFANPPEIIRGHVRTPYIAVDNQYIKARHINAIILSEFLRHRVRKGATEWQITGAFFDKDYGNNDPHYNHLKEWLEAEKPRLEALLERFEPKAGETGLKAFHVDMQRTYDGYSEIANNYQQAANALDRKVLEEKDRKRKDELRQEATELENRLERLRNERLIDYLSNNQVLPSYSFPTHSVELSLMVKATICAYSAI